MEYLNESLSITVNNISLLNIQSTLLLLLESLSIIYRHCFREHCLKLEMYPHEHVLRRPCGYLCFGDQMEPNFYFRNYKLEKVWYIQEPKHLSFELNVSIKEMWNSDQCSKDMINLYGMIIPFGEVPSLPRFVGPHQPMASARPSTTPKLMESLRLMHSSCGRDTQSLLSEESVIVIQYYDQIYIPHRVNFEIAFESLVNGKGNKDVMPYYKFVVDAAQAVMVDWPSGNQKYLWTFTPSHYMMLKIIIKDFKCTDTNGIVNVHDGPLQINDKLYSLLCSNISLPKPISIVGHGKHKFISLDIDNKYDNVLLIVNISEVHMCSVTDIKGKICETHFVSDQSTVLKATKIETKTMYESWTFSTRKGTKEYVRVHIKTLHYNGLQKDPCQLAGIVIIYMPYFESSHLTLCHDIHMDPSAFMNDNITTGSIFNNISVLTYFYGQLGFLDFRILVEAYGCPTVRDVCDVIHLNDGIDFTSKLLNISFRSKKFVANLSHHDFMLNIIKHEAKFARPNVFRANILTGRNCLTLEEGFMIRSPILTFENSYYQRAHCIITPYFTYTQNLYLSVFPILSPTVAIMGTDPQCTDYRLAIESAFSAYYLFMMNFTTPYSAQVFTDQVRELPWLGQPYYLPQYPNQNIWLELDTLCNSQISFTTINISSSSSKAHPQRIPTDNANQILQPHGMFTISTFRGDISFSIEYKDHQDITDIHCCVYIFELNLPTKEKLDLKLEIEEYYGFSFMTSNIPNLHSTTVNYVWCPSMTSSRPTLLWQVPVLHHDKNDTVYARDKYKSPLIGYVKTKLTLLKDQKQPAIDASIQFNRSVTQSKIRGVLYCKRPLKPFFTFYRGEKVHCHNKVYFIPVDHGDVSWTQAEATCNEAGAHLISINSETEWQFLLGYLSDYDHMYYSSLETSSYLFIGLIKESKWTWTDGSAYNYRHWMTRDEMMNYNISKSITTDWKYKPPISLDSIKSPVKIIPQIKTFKLFRKSPVYQNTSSWTVSIGGIKPNYSKHCTAVAINNLQEDMKWVTVSCNVALRNSFFVCEKSRYIFEHRTQNFKENNITYNQSIASIFCPPRWIFLSGNCYRMISLATNLTICSSVGGKLVTLNNYTMQHLPKGYILTKLLKLSTDSFVISQLNMDNCLLTKWSNIKQEWIYEKCDCDEAPSLSRNILCIHTPLPQQMSHKCPSGQHLCSDGTCILEIYICDGEIDCPNGDDESNCQRCLSTKSSSKAKCSSDLSDSNQQNCRIFDFHCSSGECVPYDVVCDCSVDCADGSDELCPSDICYHKLCSWYNTKEEMQLRDEHTSFIRQSTIATLSGNTFNTSICNNSETMWCTEYKQECFLRDKVCVYERLVNGLIGSCQSGAHLQNCYNYSCPGMFHCSSQGGYCVPYSHVCDGIIDCPYEEDEQNCTFNKTCRGMLKCKGDNICVHPKDQGDGFVHCPLSGDDERLCQDYQCPEQCTCYGSVFVCNGRNFTESGTPVLSRKVNSLLLQSNQIQSKDVKHLTCTYLLNLDLSYNKLTLIDHFPKDCKYLIFLDLSHNMLKSISHLMTGIFPNLLTLDVSYNLLTRADLEQILLQGMPALKFLNISNCKLSDFRIGALSKLLHLKVLDVSGNYLYSVRSESFSGIILEAFYVQSNNIIFTVQDARIISQTGLSLIQADQETKICCYIFHHDLNILCLPKVDEHKCQTSLLYSNATRLITLITCVGILLLNIVTCIHHLRNRANQGVRLSLICMALSNILVGLFQLCVLFIDRQANNTFYFYVQQRAYKLFCNAMIKMTSISLLLNASFTMYYSWVAFYGTTTFHTSAYKHLFKKGSHQLMVCLGICFLAVILGYFSVHQLSSDEMVDKSCIAVLSNVSNVPKLLIFRIMIEGLLYTFAILFYMLLIKVVLFVRGNVEDIGSQHGVAKKLQFQTLCNLTPNIIWYITDIILWVWFHFFNSHINQHILANVITIISPVHAMFNPVMYTLRTRTFLKSVYVLFT